MARKVMRSLWDISKDVRREATSTKPIGTVDDYTYGNLGDRRENMIDGIPNSASEDIIVDENQNGIPDNMEDMSAKSEDYIGIDPDTDEDFDSRCGC